MAQMRAECLAVLASAMGKRRRDDSLEQALGREARRAGLIYQDYLDIMTEVRARARKDGSDAWDAASSILGEQKERQDG